MPSISIVATTARAVCGKAATDRAWSIQRVTYWLATATSSAIQGNAGGAFNRLLTPHVEYLALGNDESTRWPAYQQMLDVADEPGFLTAIRDATNGGLALVDDALKAKLQTDTGRSLEHKKPGPPPANEPLNLDLLSGELRF